jgi:hypothetical protein
MSTCRAAPRTVAVACLGVQVTLPGPKPGTKRGCAAVRAAADRSGSQAAASQEAGAADSDSDDSLMDEEGDAGACAICYALHLPDPSKSDELGGCMLVDRYTKPRPNLGPAR